MQEERKNVGAVHTHTHTTNFNRNRVSGSSIRYNAYTLRYKKLKTV